MPTPKENILNNAFNDWFNSRYKEISASEMLQKWQNVDTFCQIGITITAAGSAISGWQLWTMPGMGIFWSAICGMISLIAIGHRWFRVVDKIKVWSETKQTFTMLRNQLETLKFEVDQSFQQNQGNIEKTYREIKKIYTERDKNTPGNDPWLTKSLEEKIVWKVYNSIEKTSFEKELALSKAQYYR